MFCRLKSCRKCGGDLVLDGDEWRCWQCGQYYYPTPLLTETLGEAPGEGLWRRRIRMVSRTMRHINSLIRATDRSDQRWWIKNQKIIGYLDEGRNVREISLLVGQGERQIRIVRERLHDLRTTREDGPAASEGPPLLVWGRYHHQIRTGPRAVARRH